jgi:thiol:disulfide interchange protein DsbA
MNRRDCLTSALALAAGSLTSRLAQAQGAPQEGAQYQRVSHLIGGNSPGKIELIEFFWYGCPHCFLFDPQLKQWLTSAPADVSFRRVHAGYNGLVKLHQRFFYTLEALGVEEALHERVFQAIQIERQDAMSETAMQTMAVKLGVNADKFRQAWTSFGVQSKCLQATRLFDDSGADGVPTLCIGGRFITSPAMVGTHGMTEQQMGLNALRVTDYLIGLARRG